MYSVKRESGGEICRGCLSTDRRLSPLANYNLFFSLLNNLQKLEVLKCPTLLFCWECNALLRRINLFQIQVQTSHRLLEDMVDELPIQGLSQLSVTHIQDNEVINQEFLNGIDEPLVTTIKDEENRVPIEEINLNLNDNDDHDFLDCNNSESDIRLHLEEETTDNNLEEAIITPLKKRKRKLKTVKKSKTKIKRKQFDTNTNIKINPNRPGLRSSGKIIATLNTSNKLNKKIKREAKKERSKNLLNKEVSDLDEIIDRVNKENKPLDSDVALAAKDLQNEFINNSTESNTESDLQKLENSGIDDLTQKEKIEIENGLIEHNDSQNDDDSQSDSDNDRKLMKRKGAPTKDRWMNIVRLTFDIIEELDEYFVKVDLNPDEIKEILDNELSYKCKELPYGCNYCGFCFQLLRTLQRHKRDRHRQIARCKNPVYLMYRCKICHKTVRKDHTEAHMKYLHRLRYYCKECDKSFWDIEEGRDHYRVSHEEPRSFQCDVCSKTMMTKRAMENHIREHHLPMSCPACGHGVRGVRGLRAHRQRAHAADEPPEQRYCAPCGKQFASLMAYHVHARYGCPAHRRHPPERFPCTVCGKVLSTKLSMKYHHARYHGDKTNFHCLSCDKYFARRSGLSHHVKTVHLMEKAPKDKLCSFCGRGFSSQRMLRFHVRTHTGERPHECPHCPAAFAQPYPLKKHLATQHGAAPGPPAGGPGGPRDTSAEATATQALGPRSPQDTSVGPLRHKR